MGSPLALLLRDFPLVANCGLILRLKRLTTYYAIDVPDRLRMTIGEAAFLRNLITRKTYLNGHRAERRISARQMAD
jgi:hypothetical protein